MPNTERVNTAKNSTCIIPTDFTSVSISYRRISTRQLLRQSYTAEPESYIIEIRGKSSRTNGADIRYNNYFNEHHPLMALGRAVAEFYCHHIVGIIDSVTIYRRIVKHL